MPKKATGRMPGDLCPGCKEGRLAVRTTDDGSGGGGIGGYYSCRTIVAHLVCNSCSGMYEAVDRGKDAKAVLEAQLRGYENPKESPMVCPICDGSLSDQVSGEPDDCIVTHFRSCEGCLTVVWVLSKETQPETGWSPKFAGDRRPSSPPLPHEPGRHRR